MGSEMCIRDSHYAFVAPLGSTLFSGHASDGANIADILLLGGHYAGSRGAYGVQGGGPFLGGREDASGTYRRA